MLVLLPFLRWAGLQHYITTFAQTQLNSLLFLFLIPEDLSPELSGG